MPTICWDPSAAWRCRGRRVVAPGGTVHMVSRCNNREFCFKTTEDFELLLAHLEEMCQTYEVTVYAYALMSNHFHLLLQAPTAHELSSTSIQHTLP